jgi:hypothetical protein
MMPRTILHDLASLVPAERHALPLKRWSAFIGVAVGGSLLYGASLSWVLPGWGAGDAAVWLALSAGLAWCVFIPALYAATELQWRDCFDACLVTMALGEVVLASGALVNALLRFHAMTTNAALINGLVVALSNIVMAGVLTRLLRPRGVAVGRTVALWTLALNGSGAVFFFVLHRVFLAS